MEVYRAGCGRCVWCVCSVVVALLLCGICTANSNQDNREYCQLEDFYASCQGVSSSAVIVMTSARYGRMSLGRCVTTDYGSLGCHTDVLAEVDRRCSGRRVCRFEVAELHTSNSCPGDLTPYLEADYQCLEVYHPDSGTTCDMGRPLRITTPSGYIASVLTEEQQYGSDGCPWTLVAAPGQRINITLHNYARVPLLAESGAGGDGSHGGFDPLPAIPRPRVCYQLAIISERGSQERTITECLREPRISHVLISRSHQLQVTMLNKVASDVYFLLHYQFIGCANVATPPGAQVRRSGETLEVRCNYTDQSWRVTCEEGEWVGTVGNCTQVSEPKNDVIFGNNAEFPFGILLVVSIGVALGVFFGGVLLTFASLYMKKRRVQREQQRAADAAAAGGDERIYNFSPDGENTKNFILSQQQQTLGSHHHHHHTTPTAGQCMTMTRTATATAGGGGAGDPRVKDVTILEPAYHQYGYTDGQTIAYTPRVLGGHIYESPQYEQKPS